MILIRVQPSARLTRDIYDSLVTTTKEDLPPERILLGGIPRVGEHIEDNDDSGRSWEVVRVHWTNGQEGPIIEVQL